MKLNTFKKQSAVIVAGFIIGLIIRFVFLDISTRSGYIWDHFDNIGQGLDVENHGLDIYTIEKKDLAVVPGFIYQNNKIMQIHRQGVILPNYPPLAELFFWIQIKLLPRPINANTFIARLVMSIFSMLAEIAAAAGLFFLVKDLFDEKTGMVACIICWLYPPIFLNSTMWGQIDSFMIAPCIWLLWAIFKRNWIIGGMLFALACLLKPLSLIFGPIALFAAFIIPFKNKKPDFKTILIRLLKMGTSFLLTIFIITLPWIVKSGFAWIERSYISSFLNIFPVTTLKGFNIWYLDLLLHDTNFVQNAKLSTNTVLGLSKDFWGQALTMTAMISFMILCWKRLGRSNESLIVFSALWLWSIFMLPTRVHERFIIYCIPFVIVLAFKARWIWIILICVTIVGIAGHTWNLWLGQVPAGSYSPQESYMNYLDSYEMESGSVPLDQRPSKIEYQDYTEGYKMNYVFMRSRVSGFEYFLTIISILSYLYMILGIFIIHYRGFTRNSK